ncbi:MAG: trypsin-like peptidase domain-containing protein [Candidatus Dormiibacterota bacterium]
MSDLETPSPEPAEPAKTAPAPDAALTPPAAAEPVAAPETWWVAPSTPPLAPPLNNSLWHRIAAGVVVAAVVAAAAGAGIGWSLARNIDSRTSTAQTNTQTQTQPQAQQPKTPIQPAAPSTGSSLDANAIAARVDPAIVDINTVIGSGQAAGTGMIITSTGEILTNHHVVNQSTSIQVVIAGHSQKYAAHVIAIDPTADIALIQIDGGISGLPTVSFASSSSVNIGDNVVALGNALGRGGAPHVSQGSITDLDQTITASEGGNQSEQLTGMIQTDAVIYPGDSGGPLVNSAGQVVGMITAGEAQGFRSTGSSVNYSIPSDTLLSVVNEIRSGQTSSDLIYGQWGYIGVSVHTLDAQSAAQLGYSVSSGALVISVVAGAPAEQAGITRNSVITSVGGQAVTSIDTLGAAVHAHKPSDRVSVTWVNASGSHTATVTLGAVNP